MAFNPRKLDAILQQAAALYEGGQSGQARQLASDVLKKDPRNIGGLRIFALASTNSMQWPEAVKAAETAAAFTDYMARKQVELTERTLALQHSAMRALPLAPPLVRPLLWLGSGHRQPLVRPW